MADMNWCTEAVSYLNEDYVRGRHTPITVRALSSTRAAEHQLCEGHRENGERCGEAQIGNLLEVGQIMAGRWGII